MIILVCRREYASDNDTIDSTTNAVTPSRPHLLQVLDEKLSKHQQYRYRCNVFPQCYRLDRFFDMTLM